MKLTKQFKFPTLTLVTDLSLIYREFMKIRFGNYQEDKAYEKEWVDRFLSGHPEHHMDSQSLKIYKRILKKRGKI